MNILKIIYEDKDVIKGLTLTKSTDIVRQYKQSELNECSLFLMRYSTEQNPRYPKVAYILSDKSSYNELINKNKNKEIFKLIRVFDFKEEDKKKPNTILSKELQFDFHNLLGIAIPKDLGKFTIYNLKKGDIIQFSFFKAYIEKIDIKNNKVVLKDSKNNIKDYSIPVFNQYFDSVIELR